MCAVYVFIWNTPPFSIFIAPQMALNKCKLLLHINLKLKCNLNKCFKMHFKLLTVSLFLAN